MTRRIENYENAILSHEYKVPYTTTVIFHPEWTAKRKWVKNQAIPFPGNYPMSSLGEAKDPSSSPN